jgi:flagellar basal body rod protein FlgC
MSHNHNSASPARAAMVGVISAVLVIAAWQARPQPKTDVAASPALSVMAVQAASSETEAGAEPVVEVEPVAEDAGPVQTMPEGAEPLEFAAPTEGYVSAAPLNIVVENSDGPALQAGPIEALGCVAYIEEEWRRDGLGLIDWDAHGGEEFSDDDYLTMPIEHIDSPTDVLYDGDEVWFDDMSELVAISDIAIERLLEVTSRCWQLGAYELFD